MNKQEFLTNLRQGLSHLPRQDMEERLTFYSEIIDDYMEEGLSEADAVAKIGTVEQIVAQLPGGAPAKAPKRRIQAWEILLLVLTSPIWLSLYAVLWVAIVSLWAAFGALAACAVSGVVGGAGLAASGNALQGMASIGAGLICAGLSIFLFFGCKAATMGTLRLTRKLFLTVILKRRHTNG